MNVRPALTGKIFGRLRVLGPAPMPKGRGTYWRCVCECGAEKIVRRDCLVGGGSKSCGCLQREVVVAHSYRHGGAVRGKADRAYVSWKAMLDRCCNPKHEAYERYAGRGITVCARWMDFKNFRADMGERPTGLTLERVDNDKGYERDNCEWVTPKAQANNRRDNIHLSFCGRTLPVSSWAQETGISVGLITKRLLKGWPVERALTEPIHIEKRNHVASLEERS